MKIGALEEYGLRCLLQMARHSGRQLGITEIAQAEGLSAAYVGKVLYRLRRAGLVTSIRGAKGGYTLALPPREISMARVTEALAHMPKDEKSICQLFPGQRRECIHFNGSCSIRTVWGAIYKNIWALLSQTTLEDLLRDNPIAAPSLKTRGKQHAAA